MTKTDDRMKRLSLCILYLASIISCSKITQEQENNAVIRLKVAVAETAVGTRAAADAVPYRGSAPTADNPLNAYVFFSDVPGVYQHAPVAPTYLPARTKVSFKDSNFTHPDQVNGANLMYPVGDASVYCVGLAPSDGQWIVSDDCRTASHQIDGSTDIMHAGQLEGKWSAHFPMQEYRHALTWIKIGVCGTDVEAKDFWGKIQSISVKSQDKVNIELGTGVLTYDGGEKDIMAFEGSSELKPTISELGSVFCSPSDEFRITINSERIKDKVVTVSLPTRQTAANAAGKVYVVELLFNSFDVVEGKCSIKPWEYQDENISMK